MDESSSHQALDAIASLYLSGPEADVAAPEPAPIDTETDTVQWHIDQALRQGRQNSGPESKHDAPEPHTGDPWHIGPVTDSIDSPPATDIPRSLSTGRAKA